MKDEKEAQKLYLELRLLTGHIKEMQQRMQAVEEQSLRVVEVIEALDELSQTKKGKKALVPVSDGIFVPTILAETDSLVVNVGADVAVRKSIPDTKVLLRTKLDELRAHRDELAEELNRAAEAAQETEQRLVDILKKEQEGEGG